MEGVRTNHVPNMVTRNGPQSLHRSNSSSDPISPASLHRTPRIRPCSPEIVETMSTQKMKSRLYGPAGQLPNASGGMCLELRCTQQSNGAEELIDLRIFGLGFIGFIGFRVWSPAQHGVGIHSSAQGSGKVQVRHMGIRRVSW